ncbi:TMEM175 family protein [Acidocella aromatica]|uniref:Putative membrane protein n=1 Tax=Acidocella aromatica TaxID=1303579 RepID=A0A840VLF2_9PROT|nr:TMEM175 family protein [Acidocella aromatica]MBB5372411.1 putative membrane protein [Acidocella aromatica]
MHKGRLEAFTDGVMAIIITVMVLDLHVPHGNALADLLGLWPVFLSYVLSFTYVGIYWNNHHHMFQVSSTVSGAVLWANLHLLFWLSLLPFTTGWIDENALARWPVALFGFDLFMAAIAYFLLQHALIVHQGARSIIARAVGRDAKGWASALLYLAGIALAVAELPRLAYAVLWLPALLWVIPDKRIECVAEKAGEE